MKNEMTPEAPYNNTNNNYFPIPRFFIRTSIDVLKISIRNYDVKDLICDFLMCNGFKSIQNYKLDKGNYSFNWKFGNPKTNISVEMIYGPKIPGMPGVMIKIHDLDQEFLKSLDSALKKFKATPNLSYVELAFDFYSNERRRVQESLVKHLYLKNQRTKSRWFKTTFYATDGRKSGKGLTVYLKENNGLITRMELRLKSQVLKRMGIRFPLDTVDSLDLFRLFSFMDVDEERLKEHLIWSNRKLIEDLNNRKNRRPGSGDLVIRQIESWIRSISLEPRSFMEKVETLRSTNWVSNYSRFLRPLDGFNAEFLEQVSKQNFVKWGNGN